MLAAALACGSSQHPTPAAPADPSPTQPSPAQPAGDKRTPIEKRRDAACDNVAAKLTACALDDAKADLAAGKVKKADFDKDTAPDILRQNTEKYARACKSSPMSTRQVRVLEVCFQEEPRCGPLLDCLDHLNDRAPSSTKP